jgi:ABC-type polysaccharide/polyol phosphate export permease
MKSLAAADAIGRFATALSSQRRIVATLASRELRARHAGTALGALWIVLPQMLMLAVYWFVFSVGLRVRPSHGVPFIAFFVCGFIPWTLFNETVMSASGVVQRNVHLVKKTLFPTEVLAISELLVALVGHAVMLSVLLVIFWASGMAFSAYTLQLFYYLFALCVFSVAVGLLVCAMNVLMPDIGHALTILMNVWFWLTPIVWDPSPLTGTLRVLVGLNPVAYIVDGYRASFINQEPFWRQPAAAVYFWIVCLSTLGLGVWVFEKLKPTFAEVL